MMATDLQALAPAARQELADLCTSAGDLFYLVGNNLAEGGSTGPTMEGAVAAVALAQTAYGHARQMYRLAAQVQGLSTHSVGEDLPDAGQRVTVPFLRRPLGGWIGLMAGLFAVYTATGTVLRALAATPALAVHLQKVIEEQEETLWYAGGWVESLARAGGAVTDGLNAALAPMLADMQGWVDGVDGLAAAVAAGVLPGPGELRARYRGALAAATAGLPLRLPAA